MTSGAPEPQARAVVAPPLVDAGAVHRPSTAWLPWVVTPLVVLLVGGALDAVDQVAPETEGGTSSRYVPPDGHRSVTIDVSGVQSVAEATRSIGVEGVFAAPPTVAATLFGALGDDIGQAQWWRSSYVNDRGERGADLFRLSEDGVAQVATWGGPIGFVFEPAILLLPAEVQLGDTWRSEGDALPGGGLTYTADFVALRADGPFRDLDGREIPLTGGCLGVESTIVITNADGSLSTTLDDAAVWCPGRGAVWSSGTIEGEPSGRFELRPELLAALPTDSRPTPGYLDLVDDSSRLLPGRVLPLRVTDPFYGESEVSGQFRVPPSVTADGRLVMVNDQGDDVQAFTLDRASASLAWFGHPGGAVVSVGVAGDLVVATNAQRRVVAYDGLGRRIWSWGADELVIAPPVAATNAGGAVDVIVAARSGTVSRLDAERGVALWSQSLDADARTPVVVADGLVLVADERERLTALNVTTGAVEWQNELGLVARLAADETSGLVGVMLESGSLVALDLESGDERWRTVVAGTARDVLVTPDLVVAMSEEATSAIDVTSGQVVWRAAGGEAIVGDSGSSVVTLVVPGAIELRATASGDVVDRQEIDATGATSSVFALAAGEGLVVVESTGVLRRWELREPGAER